MVSAFLRRGMACLFLVLTGSLVGCGGVKLEPVEGKAMADGKPVTNGSLLFKPDAAKGNTSTLEPAGQIDSSGNYKMFTNHKPGAPAGWYKVIVIATEPIDPKDPYAPRKSFVDGKYNGEQTTDLALEVIANAPPGAYDLKMKN